MRHCYRSFFLFPFPPPFLIAVNQPAKHINPQIQTGITHCSVLSKRSGFKRQIVGITYWEWLTYESSFLSATAASFPHPQGRLCVKRLRRTYSPICFFCRLYFFYFFLIGSEWQEVAVPASCRHGKGCMKTNMIKKKVFVLCGWGNWGFQEAPFSLESIKSEGIPSSTHCGGGFWLQRCSPVPFHTSETQAKRDLTLNLQAAGKLRDWG